ncbi:hypothetical protein PR048_032421 [Dryococelus australis]|uniref:Uncharacterized protein n=1 Tax=Dryococelus australis TaxID=614101 RepID=A0ABQ9G552_9NEOP|nr:hypothetical protein PR048_032421 [Dryococelus australis]
MMLTSRTRVSSTYWLNGSDPDPDSFQPIFPVTPFRNNSACNAACISTSVANCGRNYFVSIRFDVFLVTYVALQAAFRFEVSCITLEKLAKVAGRGRRQGSIAYLAVIDMFVTDGVRRSGDPLLLPPPLREIRGIAAPREDIWIVNNIEFLKADEREAGCRNVRAGEKGDPRESPPTSSGRPRRESDPVLLGERRLVYPLHHRFPYIDTPPECARHLLVNSVNRVKILLGGGYHMQETWVFLWVLPFPSVIPFHRCSVFASPQPPSVLPQQTLAPISDRLVAWTGLNTPPLPYKDGRPPPPTRSLANPGPEVITDGQLHGERVQSPSGRYHCLAGGSMPAGERGKRTWTRRRLEEMQAKTREMKKEGRGQSDSCLNVEAKFACIAVFVRLVLNMTSREHDSPVTMILLKIELLFFVATQRDMIDCKYFCTIEDIWLGHYQLDSPLVDDRPIMNTVKYKAVSGVVWTNRTMVSSNTDTNGIGVLAIVDIGDSIIICLKFQWRVLIHLNIEDLRVDEGKRGGYGATPECKGGGNGRFPRKSAHQRHYPARFPLAKIRVRYRRESKPVRLGPRRVVQPLHRHGHVDFGDCNLHFLLNLSFRMASCTIVVRSSIRDRPIAKFVSYLISISHFGTKIKESEIQNRAISLVQHIYNGTKIKMNPGSELGSFNLGSGKTLVQPGVRETLGEMKERIKSSMGGGKCWLRKTAVPREDPRTIGNIRHVFHMRRSVFVSSGKPKPNTITQARVQRVNLSGFENGLDSQFGKERVRERGEREGEREGEGEWEREGERGGREWERGGERVTGPARLRNPRRAFGQSVCESSEFGGLRDLERKGVRTPEKIRASRASSGDESDQPEDAGLKGPSKREICEKTRRPTASSGTIPTCKNLVTRPCIELGSPWWEASRLTAQPPWPLDRLNIVAAGCRSGVSRVTSRGWGGADGGRACNVTVLNYDRAAGKRQLVVAGANAPDGRLCVLPASVGLERMDGVHARSDYDSTSTAVVSHKFVLCPALSDSEATGYCPDCEEIFPVIEQGVECKVT